MLVNFKPEVPLIAVRRWRVTTSIDQKEWEK